MCGSQACRTVVIITNARLVPRGTVTPRSSRTTGGRHGVYSAERPTTTLRGSFSAIWTCVDPDSCRRYATEWCWCWEASTPTDFSTFTSTAFWAPFTVLLLQRWPQYGYSRRPREVCFERSFPVDPRRGGH